VATVKGGNTHLGYKRGRVCSSDFMKTTRGEEEKSDRGQKGSCAQHGDRSVVEKGGRKKRGGEGWENIG